MNIYYEKIHLLCHMKIICNHIKVFIGLINIIHIFPRINKKQTVALIDLLHCSKAKYMKI